MTASALLLAISALVIAPSPVSAATGGCYAYGCNGLNPVGKCDGDAFTVASKSVHWGVLELRYSPSCVANWGRYTPGTREAWNLLWMGKGIWVAQLTSWNPHDYSYGIAYRSNSLFGASWSTMTDGRRKACTGVEVVITSDNGDYDSQGWDWGVLLLSGNVRAAKKTLAAPQETRNERNYMDHKKRLQKVIIASLLTGLTILTFRWSSFPDLQPDTNPLIVVVAVLGANLLAAVPGWLMMTYYRVKHATAISVAGVLASFLLHTLFAPPIISLVGRWSWGLTFLLLVIGSYVGADSLTNRRRPTPDRD